MPILPMRVRVPLCYSWRWIKTKKSREWRYTETMLRGALTAKRSGCSWKRRGYPTASKRQEKKNPSLFIFSNGASVVKKQTNEIQQLQGICMYLCMKYVCMYIYICVCVWRARFRRLGGHLNPCALHRDPTLDSNSTVQDSGAFGDCVQEE